MNYKTYGDIANDIQANITKIPNDIDLVVGIPGSGIIPAGIIAQALSKPVRTLSEFLDGQEIWSSSNRVNLNKEIRKVLIVDDSILSGGQMQRVADKIKQSGLDEKYEIIYAAVYSVSDPAPAPADIFLMQLSHPRMFQWNYLNHLFVSDSAWDIDGLLCIDPTSEQNDDGEKYREFILNATPLHIPDYDIGYIITSRLEKWRPETEKWLAANGVKYGKLIMLDGVSAQERAAQGLHALFKAQKFGALPDARYFYESNRAQAQEIAHLTGKPCFCTETGELFQTQNNAQRIIPLTDKLEIGPGFERIPGFCTLNITKTGITDYVADMQNGLPFPDESFNVVYASHIFEHILWYMQDKVLADLFRIIKTGGYADIWVHDALKIAKAFVDAETRGGQDFHKDGWYRLNEERDPAVWFNGRIFSYGGGYGTKGHFNIHLTAWSPRLLKKKLLAAGFSRVEFLPRTEVRGFDHGWINLGVRAWKGPVAPSRKKLARKYRKYRLLQFLTLGLVGKFRKKKNKYRRQYRAI